MGSPLPVSLWDALLPGMPGMTMQQPAMMSPLAHAEDAAAVFGTMGGCGSPWWQSPLADHSFGGHAGIAQMTYAGLPPPPPPLPPTMGDFAGGASLLMPPVVPPALPTYSRLASPRKVELSPVAAMPVEEAEGGGAAAVAPEDRADTDAASAWQELWNANGIVPPMPSAMEAPRKVDLEMPSSTEVGGGSSSSGSGAGTRTPPPGIEASQEELQALGAGSGITTAGAPAQQKDSCVFPPGLKPPPGVSNHGSVLHAAGQCRPCAWFWKAVGCQRGEQCDHCHLCPSGENKARRKARQAMRHTVNAANAAMAFLPPQSFQEPSVSASNICKQHGFLALDAWQQQLQQQAMMAAAGWSSAGCSDQESTTFAGSEQEAASCGGQEDLLID